VGKHHRDSPFRLLLAASRWPSSVLAIDGRQTAADSVCRVTHSRTRRALRQQIGDGRSRSSRALFSYSPAGAQKLNTSRFRPREINA
jgi:hypothetical protein